MNQAYLTTSVSPKGIKSGTRTIDERPGDPVFLKDMRKFSIMQPLVVKIFTVYRRIKDKIKLNSG